MDSSKVSEDVWAIRPNGFGPFPQMPTYEQAKSAYPNAKIKVGRNVPGAIWKNGTDSSFTDYEFYVTFWESGNELFRASCFCQDAEGKIAIPKFDVDGGKFSPFVPIIISPKYHTENGITVGDSIGNLIKAYPHAGALYARRVNVMADFDDVENVCFLKDVNEGAHPGTIEYIVFHAKPAEGKKNVGTYSEKEIWVTKHIDANAVITAIEPNTPCNLDDYKYQ